MDHVPWRGLDAAARAARAGRGARPARRRSSAGRSTRPRSRSGATTAASCRAARPRLHHGAHQRPRARPRERLAAATVQRRRHDTGPGCRRTYSAGSRYAGVPSVPSSGWPSDCADSGHTRSNHSGPRGAAGIDGSTGRLRRCARSRARRTERDPSRSSEASQKSAAPPAVCAGGRAAAGWRPAAATAAARSPTPPSRCTARAVGTYRMATPGLGPAGDSRSPPSRGRTTRPSGPQACQHGAVDQLGGALGPVGHRGDVVGARVGDHLAEGGIPAGAGGPEQRVGERPHAATAPGASSG